MNPKPTAIADTGCTWHFLHIDAPCDNISITKNGIYVNMPNNQRIQATHTGSGNLPGNLPAAACKAHLLQELHSSLLSIGQLCDHGCEATLTETQVIITRNNKVIITGYRDPQTNLWRIPINPMAPTPTAHPGELAVRARLELAYQNQHGRPAPRPFEFDEANQMPQANNAYQTSTNRELIQFLHAACGSPVPSTWIAAIDKGHFATWPGLTADLVRKHLPKTIATVKGQLNQHRKNVRSTKPKMAPMTDSPDLDTYQQQLESNIRIHHVYTSIINLIGQIATDLTGRFPVTSSRRNKYIMVLYCFDSNAILTEPMKSKAESGHLHADSKLHQYLVDRGFRPLRQFFDNEASADFQRGLQTKQIEYQLAPPNMHRRNPAEQAIQTFK
jgi:hypothetical protein